MSVTARLNLFMIFAPLEGWCHVKVTDRHTGVDYAYALKDDLQLCREFVLLCRRVDLFSDASIAIDGSKFKAVNTRDRNFTQAKMQRRLKQIDEKHQRFEKLLVLVRACFS